MSHVTFESPCLDADTAAAYVAHGLDAAERAGVEQHIDTCPSCRELVSTVARLHWSQTSAHPSRTTDAVTASIGGVLPAGTRVGPFEIIRPLDAGGMGLVYAAHDSRLDRHVALKSVRERRGQSQQLLREAKMMAQLSHPNVVPAYDVIEAHGQIYLAMELVVGRTVRQWLEGAPRTWQQVVDVFIEAGQGLAAAHAAGIVHGDFKPANVLFGDDGRIRVTDFGLALSAADAPRELPARGTPAYMAPEQNAGAAPDARADQYAFCVSLHEALFGALPQAKALKHPRLPRTLKRAIERGLSSEPALRHPSMQTLISALRRSRSSRTKWAVAGASFLLIAAALSYDFGGRQARQTLCEHAAPTLVIPWDESVRTALYARFHASDVPLAEQTFERVAATFDRWAADFANTREKACKTGWFRTDTPLERFAAQLDCLSDRARAGRALVSQLRDVDQTLILNSVAATEALALPSTCATETPRTRPRTLGETTEVTAIREKFAHTSAALDTGRFQQVLPAAQAQLADAEALGDDRLIASALVTLGSIHSSLSKFETASALLTKALRLAETAQDDAVRATGWVCLLQNEYKRGHHEQVVFLKDAALGACERTDNAWLQSEVLMQVGGSLSELGRADDAQAAFEQAIALRRTLYGDHDRRLGFALSAYGNAMAMRGNLDAGIASHQEALAIGEQTLGAPHPSVATLRTNLADDYLYALLPEQAIPLFETSLRYVEAANGPRTREAALTVTDLALAYLEAGQFDAALAAFDRAESTWAELNPKHPLRAMAVLGQFRAHQALGHPADLAPLERALSWCTSLPPFERGRFQLTLGTALPSSDRSISLVKSAAEGLSTSTLPLIARERRRAVDWLVAHGVQGAP